MRLLIEEEWGCLYITHVGEVEDGCKPVKEDTRRVSVQSVLRKTLESSVPQIGAVKDYVSTRVITGK